MNNTDIMLDPNKVINKTATKSSLTDMHEVYVFKDVFIEKEKTVKEEKCQEMEKMEDVVLTTNKIDNSSLEWTNLVLSQETESYVKDLYDTRQSNATLQWMLCIILSICVFCIAIRIEDRYRQKRRRQQHENYDYS